jgi:hypothetical protein
MRIFKNIISKYEGTEKLLYSDQSNPYESIYIRAKISNGLLTITDSECEHGPDGGWSHRTLTFDKINTELALKMLQKKSHNPFKALKGMLNYNDRTKVFQEMCDSHGIKYRNTLTF